MMTCECSDETAAVVFFYCDNVKQVSEWDQAQAHTPQTSRRSARWKATKALRRIITQTPGDCSSRSATSNWSLLTKSELFILVFTKNEKSPVCPITMHGLCEVEIHGKSCCYTYSETIKQPPGIKSCRNKWKHTVVFPNSQTVK